MISTAYSDPNDKEPIFTTEKAEVLGLEQVSNFVCWSVYDVSFCRAYKSDIICVSGSVSVRSIDQNFTSSHNFHLILKYYK